MSKKTDTNQKNDNISKTKKDELDQLKRREKSPDHGTKICTGHDPANPKNPRVKKMEEELLERRAKAPENKGAKIKITPQKEVNNSKRVAKDEEELIRRRKNSPQNKPQGSR